MTLVCGFIWNIPGPTRMVPCLDRGMCEMGSTRDGIFPSNVGSPGPLNSSGPTRPRSTPSNSVSFSLPSSRSGPWQASPADPLLRRLDLGEQRPWQASSGSGRAAAMAGKVGLGSVVAMAGKLGLGAMAAMASIPAGPRCAAVVIPLRPYPRDPRRVPARAVLLHPGDSLCGSVWLRVSGRRASVGEAQATATLHPSRCSPPPRPLPLRLPLAPALASGGRRRWVQCMTVGSHVHSS